jgi:two-component system, chemotaxis family, chemotaxis protein CheY
VRTLIVEDDFVSRLLMQEILKVYGECDIAVTGEEAVAAVDLALGMEAPYDLICLDIRMPGMGGRAALKAIRDLEEDRGITSTQGSKIIMTTVVDDPRSVMDSFYQLCDAYVFKPVDRAKLLEELVRLGLRPGDPRPTRLPPA